jgi:hypothetical protein
MLAQNPKTGKPIRILRSDASLWKNQKTLVHLDTQSADIPWDRWDTLAVGVESIQKWEARGVKLDFIALLDAQPETVDWFLKADRQKYKMIFILVDLAKAIGEQKFRSLRILNLLCVDEIHRLYPFVGPMWDGSKEDLVVEVAAVMRMSRIQGLPLSYTSDRLNHLVSINGQIQLIDEVPKQLWFITQYYKPEKAKRSREIKKCLEENLQSKCIDKVVLLNEKDFTAELPKNSKLHQEVVGHRLLYSDVLQYIQTSVPPNTICVFANADIWLDSVSWKDVWSVVLQDVFMALLRWDVQEDGSTKVFGPRNDSQDTWCLLSDSVQSRTWEWPVFSFPFGKAGCDNAITVEMLRKKFLITNPGMSLKTHHLQLSAHRTYDPKDVVDKPAYLYVDPTGIHDMQPVFSLADKQTETVQFQSFSRPLQSVQPKALETFCKMLQRDNRYMWNPQDTNVYKEEKIPLYKFSNVFQTPQGLIYGYNSLYIGREEASKDAWSKSQLSPITPAYGVKRSFAVPWREEEVKTQEGYALYYLSKILRMREGFGQGEFWAGKQMAGVLELFQWKTNELPVIPHSETSQIWCEEAIQYPWADKQELHREDIDCLRRNLRMGWEEKVIENRWVVMIDGTHITMDMVRKWEESDTTHIWSVVFKDRTSPERIVEKLKGAAGCICAGGPGTVSGWGYSWALPRGAYVVEIQNEMSPCGEAAHASGAAGLSHWLISVPRGSEKATQELISKYVHQTLQALTNDSSTSSLPILRMPRTMTGFFSHAGDSFREMATLWAEKGYVRVVEDPTAVQIWLGEIGDVLLYDRPTLDWLFAAPAAEQKWKKALFGNPKPVETGGPATSWFFWPRKPRLVEEMASLGDTPFSAREKTCVFYGKMENKVQERRRTTADWASICDDFVLVSGESTPYALSHKEYLEKVAKARFGLCLAGFGKKCHREVECMAMGCVPIVASDVDMSFYADPPVESIHYLRGETPEEMKTKMATVSEEKWIEMSRACREWWKKNASVDGSWELTKRISGQ